MVSARMAASRQQRMASATRFDLKHASARFSRLAMTSWSCDPRQREAPRGSEQEGKERRAHRERGLRECCARHGLRDARVSAHG